MLYREINITPLFSNKSFILDVPKDIQDHIFPIIKEAYLQVDFWEEDLMTISKATTFVDLLETFKTKEGESIILSDMANIRQLLELNFHKADWSIIFPDDITKVDGKFYQKTKPFQVNCDSTFKEEGAMVSSWHNCQDFPHHMYCFTIATKQTTNNQYWGRYFVSQEYTQDYQKNYIKEYIFDDLVEIDVEATIEANKSMIAKSYGVFPKVVDRLGLAKGTERALISDCYWVKDSEGVDEVEKLFLKNIR